MMNKRLLIWIIVCLNGVECVHAQWTRQDSLWLQNVLSGKEKLKLNEETLKAIESGSLLNNQPQPSGSMRMAPKSNLPITKDFSNYIQSNDTTHRKVALKDLPPQVLWWYDPPIKLIKVPAFENIPIYYSPSTALATFSLSYLTSRKHHIHKRNVKRDGTWREYDNLPTPDVISKHKSYVTQHPVAKKDSTITNKKDTPLLAKKDSVFIPKKREITPTPAGPGASGSSQRNR